MVRNSSKINTINADICAIFANQGIMGHGPLLYKETQSWYLFPHKVKKDKSARQTSKPLLNPSTSDSGAKRYQRLRLSMAIGSSDPVAETEEDRMDRLSELPEHLLLHMLSFLPTQVAARTSLLSRRFRHLWEITTVLDLDLSAHSTCAAFVDIADRALLDRDSLYSLLRLRLDLCDRDRFEGGILTFGYVNILLVRAAELRVRHLTVSHFTNQLDDFLPTILSIASLQSLSLRHLSRRAVFPSFFAATGLKTLSLTFDFMSLGPTGFNPFLSKLHALEELELEVPTAVDLHSETVKRLKLIMFTSSREVGICMPKLEVLDFYEWRSRRTQFHGAMPLLKKAKIHFMYPAEESAPAIWKMLKAVGNVEELRIIMEENYVGIFSILFISLIS